MMKRDKYKINRIYEKLQQQKNIKGIGSVHIHKYKDGDFKCINCEGKCKLENIKVVPPGIVNIKILSVLEEV